MISEFKCVDLQITYLVIIEIAVAIGYWGPSDSQITKPFIIFNIDSKVAWKILTFFSKHVFYPNITADLENRYGLLTLFWPWLIIPPPPPFLSVIAILFEFVLRIVTQHLTPLQLMVCHFRTNKCQQGSINYEIDLIHLIFGWNNPPAGLEKPRWPSDLLRGSRDVKRQF